MLNSFMAGARIAVCAFLAAIGVLGIAGAVFSLVSFALGGALSVLAFAPLGLALGDACFGAVAMIIDRRFF